MQLAIVVYCTNNCIVWRNKMKLKFSKKKQLNTMQLKFQFESSYNLRLFFLVFYFLFTNEISLSVCSRLWNATPRGRHSAAQEVVRRSQPWKSGPGSAAAFRGECVLLCSFHLARWKRHPPASLLFVTWIHYARVSAHTHCRNAASETHEILLVLITRRLCASIRKIICLSDNASDS